MSMIAPYPQSGTIPKKEKHYFDMLRPAPYLPKIELDNLAYERLVDLTSDLMAPAGEIIARPYKDHYEILFGYDYLRAYQEVVPRSQVLVSLYHYSDSEAVKVAFQLSHNHYNISVLDVAESYRAALLHFEWRNADLARALDLKPSTICNRLKLTELSDDVKKLVKVGKLSLEQAKALSRLSIKDQLRFANLSVQHDWDTRQLYKKIHPDWRPKGQVVKGGEATLSKDGDVLRLEQQLGDVLSCPVKLDVDKAKKSTGKMRIPFFSISELSGFVERIERSTEEEQRWKGEIHLTVDGLDHLDGMLSDIYPKEDF
jgi:ParB-like chromosome segregation protein Spo0J